MEPEHELEDMSESQERQAPPLRNTLRNLHLSCFTCLRRWPRNIVSFNQSLMLLLVPLLPVRRSSQPTQGVQPKASCRTPGRPPGETLVRLRSRAKAASSGHCWSERSPPLPCRRTYCMELWSVWNLSSCTLSCTASTLWYPRQCPWTNCFEYEYWICPCCLSLVKMKCTEVC